MLILTYVAKDFRWN